MKNSKEIRATKITELFNPKIIVFWQDEKGRIIERIHPTLQATKILVKGTQITTFPFKIKIDPPKTPNGRDIKNIIEQNNFTNQNIISQTKILKQ